LILARISETRGELRQASGRDQGGTKAGSSRFAQLEQLSHVVRKRILRSVRNEQTLQRFFRRLLRVKEGLSCQRGCITEGEFSEPEVLRRGEHASQTKVTFLVDYLFLVPTGLW